MPPTGGPGPNPAGAPPSSAAPPGGPPGPQGGPPGGPPGPHSSGPPGGPPGGPDRDYNARPGPPPGAVAGGPPGGPPNSQQPQAPPRKLHIFLKIIFSCENFDRNYNQADIIRCLTSVALRHW